MACYVFGLPPERFNAMEKMLEDIIEPMERYVPVLSYEPIPIYGEVIWDFTSEAIHILLIAPSGAGKTRLLVYFSGMVLRHLPFVRADDAGLPVFQFQYMEPFNVLPHMGSPPFSLAAAKGRCIPASVRRQGGSGRRGHCRDMQEGRSLSAQAFLSDNPVHTTAPSAFCPC